ncbi:dual oxidase-like [Lineus longissimus]|uniref:dual oxidase-like n=1 Tax=Lineus longissimus TaxID=88925 RepID=UPI00315CC9B9
MILRHVFLVTLCHLVNGGSVDYQRYDGWYNNLANPTWGATDTHLSRKLPPRYDDSTYAMSMRNRPNPRDVTNGIFRGQGGIASGMNRTTLFVFFGEFVAHELFDVTMPSCPVELNMVSIEKCDAHLDPDCKGGQSMPYLRSDFDHKTGQQPNRARIPFLPQLNRVSSWIDGSFLYGKHGVWSSVLRSRSDGKLSTSDDRGHYPGLNKAGLPLKSLPKQEDREIQNIYEKWMFGNPYSHENPALMSISLIWFRWHNLMADVIKMEDPNLDDEAIYRRARRWTIATMQNIIMYEWLPVFLNETAPPYDGYFNSVYPALSPLFTTAMQFYQTSIPPGIYLRDEKCNFQPLDNKTDNVIRLCNSYWNSQAILQRSGLEKIVLGLASQVAEREDHHVVEDIRGMFYGLYHCSRLDATAIEIMRGRDFGLSDYQTATAAFGLQTPTKLKDVNPELFAREPELLQNLTRLYNSTMANLDVFAAMLLEADGSNPGPLVKAVVMEQFIRLRKADRFWFENLNNGLFNQTEIAKIKATTLSDVIQKILKVPASSIQQDVFFATHAPCQQPRQMTSDDLEPCSPLLAVDYFDGSEITFVTSFICVAVFPLLCILIAYIIAKIKMKKHEKFTKKKQPPRKSMAVEIIDAVFPDFKVTEWRGKEEPCRQVQLGLDVRKMELHVLDERNTTLRLIDLRLQLGDVAIITTAKNKTRQFKNLINFHVKKGYDLVIEMANSEDRNSFIAQLGLHINKIGKRLQCNSTTVDVLLKKAVTKQKRKDLLETFFRVVFAQTYQTEHERKVSATARGEREQPIQPTAIPPTAAEGKISKEVLACELTKHEFAESLAMEDNSLFVENLFSLVDTDNSGSISCIELMKTVVLMTKVESIFFFSGSAEEKLRLFFRIYDADGDGYLDRKELEMMLRSLTDMAKARLETSDMADLMEGLIESAGGTERGQIGFDQFKMLFQEQINRFGTLSFDWKGIGKESRELGNQATGSKSDSKTFGELTEKEEYSPGKARWKAFKRYLQNYRQHIFILIIFFGVSIALFTERFVHYLIYFEDKGLRRLLTIGLPMSRGGAAGMSFCFSVILLTMCRNIITLLRQTFLNQFIPFDSNVAFHKVIAWTAVFYTALHVIGYSFNLYHIGSLSIESMCVMEYFHFRPDSPPKLDFWFYQNTSGLTGVLLCLIIVVMYVFASQPARRYIFDAFWMTHVLYVALYILTLIHGFNRIIQNPFFIFYFIGPLLLFAFDKMISTSTKHMSLSVIKATLLPSGVTYLEFKRPRNFTYLSGQWVRIACVGQGRREFHPFTLTSAPHEETLGVHIRAVGPWTWNIRETFKPAKLKTQAYPRLIMDGPYGAGQQDWFQFEVAVLVGGGIGVTPYASILKDFVRLISSENHPIKYKIKCQKVYFLWVSGSHHSFEWFIDMIRAVEEADKRGIITTHIFITQFFEKFDLRTTMLYICDEHFQKISGKSLFTGLRATTHFGRPQFAKFLTAVSQMHPEVYKVGVFSAGPPGLTRGMEKACVTASKTSKAIFKHHYENF